MGQQETAVTNKNRIMIYGPKTDGNTSLNFGQPRVKHWRSACRLERPACSSISRSGVVRAGRP
jgi:hypothetical protein